MEPVCVAAAQRLAALLWRKPATQMQPETNLPTVPMMPESDPSSGEARIPAVVPPFHQSIARRSEDVTLASGWLRVLDAPGALLWIAALALAGGALLHASIDRLPAAYSWWLPYRTLQDIASKPSFPVWALSAFLAGALSNHGWVRVSSNLRVPLAGMGRFREVASAFASNSRSRLTLLAAFLAFGVDWFIFPTHGGVGAAAVAAGTAIAVVRATPRRAVEALLNAALGIVVFATVCYWFTIVKTLTFSAGALWDARILSLEKAIFGVYPHRWLAELVAANRAWLPAMDRIYFSIFEHMAIGSCFLLGLGDRAERGRYLGALCLCYVIGAPSYLLMPGAGPVYFDSSTYAFLREQPLAVNYVQAVLFRNTSALNEGTAASIQTWGYVACMPSLHMAHELVMLYFARRSRVFLAGTLIFFLTTAVSVVALGWHYPTDILAGMVLGAAAILLSRSVGPRMFPRPLRSSYADEIKEAASAAGDRAG